MSTTAPRIELNAADAVRLRMPLPRRKRWRTLLALVAAPIAASFLASFAGMGLISIGVQEAPPVSVAIGLWFFIGAAMFLASVTICWGFHAIAFRRRWRKWLTYVQAGAATGAIIATIIVTISMLNANALDPLYGIGYFLGVSLASLAACAIPGALDAWMFWLIRRPDRDIDSDIAATFD